MLNGVRNIHLAIVKSRSRPRGLLNFIIGIWWLKIENWMTTTLEISVKGKKNITPNSHWWFSMFFKNILNV